MNRKQVSPQSYIRWQAARVKAAYAIVHKVNTGKGYAVNSNEVMIKVDGVAYDVAFTQDWGDLFIRNQVGVRIRETGTRRMAIVVYDAPDFDLKGDVLGQSADKAKEFIRVWRDREAVPPGVVPPIVYMTKETTGMFLCKCMATDCKNIHFSDLTPEKQAALDAQSTRPKSVEDKEQTWPPDLESK